MKNIVIFLDVTFFGTGIKNARKLDALLRGSAKMPLAKREYPNTPEKTWTYNALTDFMKNQYVESPDRRTLILSMKGEMFLAKGGYAGEVRRSRYGWLGGLFNVIVRITSGI